MKIVTRPKKWGNSFGIIIPSEIVKKENISDDTQVTIEIKRENPVEEIFGALKGWKIDTQKIKDVLRNEEKSSEKKKWKI